MAPGQGNKIKAVKLFRDQTGLGLAEAKEAVEAGALGEGALNPDAAQDLSANVTAALAQGNKLLAIKLLCQTNGMGLQQAKAIADNAASKVRTAGATGGHGLAPGEVQRPRRSLAVFVVLLVVAGAVAWVVFGRA